MSVLQFSALDSTTRDIAPEHYHLAANRLNALLSSGPKTREGNAQERTEWQASHQKEQEEEQEQRTTTQAAQFATSYSQNQQQNASRQSMASNLQILQRTVDQGNGSRIQ